jgi:hypothetical protein
MKLAPGDSCRLGIGFSYDLNTAASVSDQATVSGDPGGELVIPLHVELGHFIEVTANAQPLNDRSNLVIPSHQTVVDVDQMFQIKNVSTKTVTDVKVSSNIADASGILSIQDDCPSTNTLSPGQSCNVLVHAHGDPASTAYGAGSRIRLNIEGAGSRWIHTGIWYSALQTSAVTIFPTYSSGGPVPLMIANVSGHRIASVTATVVSGGYTVVGNGCSGGLDPGHNCTVSVSRASTGDYDGTLRITAPQEGSFDVGLDW